ncbi:MAG TPA: hypothetical protein VMN82_12720 [Thermoanaerobaculia bacterium]|nr:hypothetical protein [Thermoanaerobaculia bacterium]
MTFVDRDWWDPCGGLPNGHVATAGIDQVASAVTATLDTVCFHARFVGRISGDQLTGTMSVPGTGSAPATGTATLSRVSFSVAGFDVACPGGPCQVGTFAVHLSR